MTISISEMHVGQSGRVVEVNVGPGKLGQLLSMGIRPGVVITRRSAQPLRGPVIVRVSGAEVALGFGLARRIMVEVGQ